VEWFDFLWSGNYNPISVLNLTGFRNLSGFGGDLSGFLVLETCQVSLEWFDFLWSGNYNPISVLNLTGLRDLSGFGGDLSGFGKGFEGSV